MKFASKVSLRMRITLLAGAILILCSVILTITASYNARSQFVKIKEAPAVSRPLGIIVGPGLVQSEMAPRTSLVPAEVTKAKSDFDSTNMIILAIVSILGMGMVYFVAGRSLRPIHELSDTISTITEDDLQKRIPDNQRSDEVGALGQSFNMMLDRLEKSFLRQKRFSANVAHELKTPLATINAGIQVLHMEESPTVTDYKETLATTERNVKRLMAVVDDLLNLYDEQEGFETTPIHLQDMFTSILSELRPQLEGKQIETEIDCKLRHVRGNQVLLYRTFFNLMENATKYNKDKGTIRVETKVANGVGQIIISDTGNGIPSDELQQIFEPFYRVNKSRNRKTGGVGLGLSLVKTIIEKHGWKISVDSIAGLGSAFTITFKA
ncbi:sensor histidine kinase [Paenibacillus sp. GCM10012307]|uniref:histidine kinase n=1 Tax=Paenibacillus roseus TaxID=2798579 RepID=A0A934J2Q6_9BACL|nr:HAMP domain-containing sensor histidine kinase [Paenibacillus roseus]MBJ6360378.1 HAMP domain-containing histidine kinase [Paenibacillus roseus]